MDVYKFQKTKFYTFDWIINFTGIEYEKKTKRRENPLPQEEHLKLARERCNELHPDGSWRGKNAESTKEKILSFMKSNPEASINECIAGCGCSKPSVYKYWDECCMELGLNGKMRMDNSERIKVYREKNPNAKKIDCIRELGLSKSTVYKYWDME